MKVVVASYQAISTLHGGPNTQLRNTATQLARCGVDVQLFDPWTRLNTRDFDVFHIFAANVGTYHLAREIHALGVPLAVSPIVYTSHSCRAVHLGLGLGRAMQRIVPGFWSDHIFCADICSWADALLPNTRAEADLIVEGFGADRAKITVVPNGVDERFASADPELFVKTYGIRDFILNVGHVGHGRKNVLSLIKALGTIDHPAVIIGRQIRGPYGEACLREAARHKHILLIDGLDNSSDMLASAYAACDTFVLPSLFETPGIAALEAALAGAKIVITEYGGTREYFGDMARYVDPGSIDSIRQTILQTLQEKKDGRLREHIRGHYLWSHVAAQTAAAYRRLLDRHRA